MTTSRKPQISNDEDDVFGGSSSAPPTPPGIEVPDEEVDFGDFKYQPIAIQTSGYNKGSAEMQALARQRLNRKIETQKGAFPLPGGQIAVVDYIPPSYRTQKNWWLGEPRRLLKNPKPEATGYQYGWPRFKTQDSKRDPETLGQIRSGLYRPVRKKELIPNTAAAIMTHKVPGQPEEDGLVLWYGHILVEIHPEMVADQYDSPMRQAMYRVAGERDALAADIEQISGGNAELTRFDIKRTQGEE